MRTASDLASINATRPLSGLALHSTLPVATGARNDCSSSFSGGSGTPASLSSWPGVCPELPKPAPPKLPPGNGAPGAPELALESSEPQPAPRPMAQASSAQRVRSATIGHLGRDLETSDRPRHAGLEV